MMLPDDRAYGIGELARRTGVSVDALRYYERLALLPRAARTAGRERRYGPEFVRRVRFIKDVQALGLTLREIRELVGAPSGRGAGSCRRMHDLLTRHLDEIERRSRELRRLRATLRAYRQACDAALQGGPESPCPTLDAIERKQRT